MKKIFSMLLATLVAIGGLATNVFAATPPQDIRAVWISTVSNLDFPNVKNKNNVEAQKSEYISKLEALKAIGINTVVLQVRPKADALYASSINPWSDVLTGVQGQYPGYDPLAFMIEEAHKRNMSFHAWMNPYRITTSGTDLKALSSNHPARNNPSWVITYNNALYYNPALPEVKAHIVETVKEVVSNYDVDAIHFDDYFYPAGYPLPQGEGKDGPTANSRRVHINDMVAKVSKAIKETNKDVAFGISPIGIWKNNTSDLTGSSTGGNESYYSVAADTRSWIQNEWIDYVVPQIYWETGHKLADYETLVKWWSNEVKGTSVKLYIGQGVYKDVVSSEIDTQLKVNQKYDAVRGSFYFSIRDLLNNRQGAKDKIAAFNTANPLAPSLPLQVSPQPTATTNKTGVVTATSLNIRNGASTKEAIVAKIVKGTQVTILSSNNGWYKVKLSNGQIGFASSSYIQVRESLSQNEIKPVNTPATKLGTVNVKSLNLRKGAGTRFAVLKRLTAGTKISVVETSSGWHKIKLADGVIGWVSSSYITI